MYNGETIWDIARRKGVAGWEDIFDWMNHDELAANMARVLCIKHLLHTYQVDDFEEACRLHYEVGMQIRQAILDAGGIPPEQCPTPTLAELLVDHTRRDFHCN